MKEEKNITFIKGTLLGIGLGLLLAPEEGSEIRKELKKSFSKLIDSVKQIDIEENKKILMAKLNDINDELSDITTTKKNKIKTKLNYIKESCEDIQKIAEENNTPKVAEAVKKVEEKTTSIIEEIENNNEEKTRKRVRPKKKKTKKQNGKQRD